MDTHDFDVLVIGAGIAGATAAAHCAATGRVALMEAEETAGYHSTGRSAAIWIQNYGPPDVRRLSAASRAFFAEPPAGFASAPLLAQRPVVTVAPADQAAAMAAMLEDGEGLEPLPLAAIAAMGPPLREGYAVSAAIERDAFDIDVAALHAGFLKTARAAGGVLALRSRAGRIWHDRGLWHAAAKDGTVFRAPVLVNAAGAWGDEVAALAGLAPIGLQPKRRTALIIDPGQHDCSRWPLIGDAAHSWYLRPEARRKLMLSPADETDMPPHDVQPDEIDIAIAIDRMQQALDIPVTRVEHRWAGLRSFTPDRSLAIGFDAQAPGFLWMIGQGGYGIQTAPAAGRLVAGMVAGAVAEELLPILPLVNPNRFARNGAGTVAA
ncbi:FAD-binding oxidoreductase [Roseomonas frigidaquae]|uniref:FAD-binding oxidoreductase n=1 Tax=Falsiroseomonas frigidaquae TaxID=487318 RepID=A0ABX1EUB0_9PROT|nr:FAD-binding oxidoreductase [Falsiroseomonas frigidaquae]NKE44216.1 FAD-binding oxidoreductase [Falsiroseomonas frigidaquae]